MGNYQQNLSTASLKCVTVSEIQRRRVDHGYFYHIEKSPIVCNCRKKMLETEWAISALRVLLAWPKCVTVTKNLSAAAQNFEKPLGILDFHCAISGVLKFALQRPLGHVWAPGSILVLYLVHL